ncbi:lactoylglutathione lyase [Halanaerobium saccharolyticum]|uniref:Lactoylglutathione lyase n=1 Tax=Halanaerobium saccharolyticum TaxID=43595 RepID=A0A4R7Z2U6_9FIRM|nr:VOC family protein [Halanaerobium saccharolyticum]RAK07897.1 lactoylglutathione lyase [Halanaerobium saccharolyticum]TDW04511.1 lactoylglutathione lyase [Halanaerobium saccharolyticum]TDX59847.1 lactoylglutathione lyase [Halanaerobium saccharolyticum]
MSYLWTTIKVKDLVESIDFYENIVDLKVQRRFEAGPDREIAFLAAAAGQTEIELISDQDKTKSDIGKDISLGFEVDSVEEKVKFLKEKGIEIQSGPISPNPQIEFFYVLDPNGVKIQFVENK